MNSFLITLVRYIINILGVAAAYVAYKMFVKPLTLNTITPDNFQEIVTILCLLTLWPILSMKKFRPFNYYSLAIVAILIPIILYGIFSINNHSSAPSYTRLFPIEKTVIEGDEIKITAYIYEKKSWKNYTIAQDNCLELDSVQIRVVNGWLGMKVLTDELEFSRKADCQ